MFVSGELSVCISQCVCMYVARCVHVSLLLHVLASWPESLPSYIGALGACAAAPSFYKASEGSALGSSVLNSK